MSDAAVNGVMLMFCGGVVCIFMLAAAGVLK